MARSSLLLALSVMTFTAGGLRLKDNDLHRVGEKVAEHNAIALATDAGVSRSTKLTLTQALIFGDSWAKGATATWGEVLAKELNVPAHNFGKNRTTTTHLKSQVSNALKSKSVKRNGENLASGTIAIVHSGGNDQQEANDRPQAAFTELRKKDLTPKEKNIYASMKTLYGRGCRYFVVSTIPSSIRVPQNRKQSEALYPHIMEDAEVMAWLGVKKGDSVSKVAARMSYRVDKKVTQMVTLFKKNYPKAVVLNFNENKALYNIEQSIGSSHMKRLGKSSSAFWRDPGHPNAFGHSKIAEEVYKCTATLSSSSGVVACPRS